MVVVTGAAGVIGRILLPHLASRYRVRALDVRDVAAVPNVEPTRGSVTDSALLQDLFAACTYVLHLATGSSRGWDGLLEVEIEGTRAVFDAAAAAGVQRVVFASTNHVAGGLELDRVRGLTSSRAGRVDVVRPDTPYGAAKAFGEAYGRFISETTQTSVSCVRIGSVRPEADIDAAVAATGTPPGQVAPYWPPELLTADALEQRLRHTWLSHADLVRIVDEEMAATARFRLRFAVSDNPGRFWPVTVLSWNA